MGLSIEGILGAIWRPHLLLLHETRQALAVAQVGRLGPERLEVLAHDLIQNAPAGRARRPRYTVAEDSGLVIDALDGEPGVYSARFLRPDATYLERFTEIYRRLAETPSRARSARFSSVFFFRFFRAPRGRLQVELIQRLYNAVPPRNARA